MSSVAQRWVATQVEPVSSLLARLDQTAALPEGRVFVDGRRVSDPTLGLAAGACVEIYTARLNAAPFTLLAEVDGILFVDKPAGMATEPERRGSVGCLTHVVAESLGAAAAHVHALSRLDVGVSGVVLLGLTPAANRRVVALRAQGLLRRRYLAIASGCPDPSEGQWAEPIARRGASARRMAAAGGEPALTHYRVGGKSEGSAGTKAVLLSLDPATGRTHQLRVHAAHHACPLLGDRTYGGIGRIVLPDGGVLPIERIALHASWVQLGKAQRVSAPFPAELAAVWQALGGELALVQSAIDAPYRP